MQCFTHQKQSLFVPGEVHDACDDPDTCQTDPPLLLLLLLVFLAGPCRPPC
jgi:hypothetical protein